MINEAYKFTSARLIYSGSENNFNTEPWNEFCKKHEPWPTVCFIKTKGQQGRVMGMFTDVPWKADDQKYKGDGNSFVFLAREVPVDKEKPDGDKKTVVTKHFPVEGADEIDCNSD